MITPFEVLIRLLSAAILGSVIGLERQRRTWTAGLRTHMMVCLGAALLMLVSSFGFHDVVGKPGITLDPSRVAAQVVSGIGFLGAGTILFLRNEIVKGLTTAAGLWTVAAIGLAVGGGLYIEAISTTMIAFMILMVVKPLEKRIFTKSSVQILRITFLANQVKLKEVETILSNNKIAFSEASLTLVDDDRNELKIKVLRGFLESSERLATLEDLKRVEGVTEVKFD